MRKKRGKAPVSLRAPILIVDDIRISADSYHFAEELAYGENTSYLKLVVFSWVKFLDDSPLDLAKPLHVKMKFLRELQTTHIATIVARYSRLAHLMLSDSHDSVLETSQCPFLSEMKDTPIFREYLYFFRTRSPEVLRYIQSFLRFARKAKFVDPDFDAIAFRDWQDVEERIRQVKFDNIELASLRNIVSVLLGDLDDQVFLGRFGPGKVSERGIDNVWSKLSQLTIGHRLRRVFRSGRFGRFWKDVGFPTGIDSVPSCEGPGYDWARVLFVPKDTTKSRSICEEPNDSMYCQQEVKRWVYASMRKSTISRFVHLEDQSYNQAAAIHGSKYLSLDTIDLSSASDSVHIDLVKGIFPKKWLYYLLGTRTRKVILPNADIVELTKFAPMGSALCFPVQCIVFTAIVLQSYMAFVHGEKSGTVIHSTEDIKHFINASIHRSHEWFTPFSRRLEQPLVFGDDIICDSRVTEDVYSALHRLGFTVNVSKSFTGSQAFRESCGVFAYQGDDVTPFLFKIPYFQRYDSGMGADVYASTITTINNLRVMGYSHLATFLQSFVMSGVSRKARIPFVANPDEFGIFTRNKHLVPDRYRRHNADWQVDEESVWGIAPRSLKELARPDNLDEYSYVLWQRSKVRGMASPNERSSRIFPQETRIAVTWSPLR